MKAKKVIVFLMAFIEIIFLFTGCTAEAGRENERSTMYTAGEAGQYYKETEITPQEGISGRPVDFWITEEGNLLYGAYDGKNVTVYKSNDKGDSWETRSITLDENPANTTAGAKLPQNGLYSWGIPVLTPQGEVQDLAYAAGNMDSFLLVRYGQDGTRAETAFENTEVFESEEAPFYIEAAKALSGDQLLLSYNMGSGQKRRYGVLNCKTGSLYKIEENLYLYGDAGACKLSVMAGVKEEKAYLPDENGRVLSLDLQALQIEPLTQQEHLKNIKAFATDGNSFYFMTQSNQVLKGNTKNEPEMLLKGQESYALPEYTCTLMRVGTDGALYIAAYGMKETRIFRYQQEFAQPKEAFCVVSLSRSETVAAAVTRFGVEHPDISMEYEVLEESIEGQKVEDMLQVLHTRLLSSNSPDILILDGLPAAQYIQQGLLTALDGLVDSGDIYPSLLEPLKQNENIYFVPAKFSVPLLFGQAEVLDGVTSPQAMLEKIKMYSPKNPFIQFSKVQTYPPDAGQCEPIAIQLCIFDGGDWKQADGYGWDTGALFDLWYRQYQASFLQDGHLDTEILKSFLIQLKEIVAYYDIPLDNQIEFMNNQFTAAGGCVGVSLAAYTEGYSKLGYAEVDDVGILAYGLGFPNTQTAPLGCIEPGVYEPKILAGIPAGCQQPQFAAAFIEKLLEENEMYVANEGCPATRTGMAKRLEALEAEKNRNTAYSYELGMNTSYYTVKYYHAVTEEDMKHLTENLKTPLLKENLLEKTLLEAARRYCKEDWSLDEAVTQVQQKMQLWLAEQG